MKEENKLKNYPHKHLLGIEGLLPNSIKFLLDLSQEYVDFLKDNSNKLDSLKNKTCINLFFENSTRTRTSFELAGKKLGADYVINVKNENVVSKVREITGGKGVDYVVECAGAPSGINEAAQMVNRGGKICLAAFPSGMAEVDIAHVVRNNIYLYGIRGEGKTATHRAEAFMRQKDINHIFKKIIINN